MEVKLPENPYDYLSDWKPKIWDECRDEMLKFFNEFLDDSIEQCKSAENSDARNLMVALKLNFNIRFNKGKVVE